MATTTANKGGLRATATAKRTKAAQRTALPPLWGDPIEPAHEEPQESVAEATPVPAQRAPRKPVAKDPADNGGHLLASGDGLSTRTPRTRKTGTVLAEGRRAKAEAVPVTRAEARSDLQASRKAEASSTQDVPAQRKPAKGTPEHQEAQIAAGMERKRTRRATEDAKPAKAAPAKPTKASAYAEQFSRLGWAPEVTQTDALVELIAKRGSEAIYLAWMREAHVSGTSTYTIADRTVKVRNPAEAMRIAWLKPEEAQAKQAKVSSNSGFRKRAAGPTIRSIPFDHETATDAEIIAAIEGRRITWANSYAPTSETATVGNARCVTIQVHPGGHQIVSFVDPENGYRAFRLDRLENVGRKVDLVKIKQQIIASLSQKDKSKGKSA